MLENKEIKPEDYFVNNRLNKTDISVIKKCLSNYENLDSETFDNLYKYLNVKKLFLSLIKQGPFFPELIFYCSDDLKNDEDIIFNGIIINKLSYHYASSKLKSNLSVFLYKLHEHPLGTHSSQA